MGSHCYQYDAQPVTAARLMAPSPDALAIPTTASPPDHLLCSICVDVFEDPTLHGCGLHAFCRGCLESLAAATHGAASRRSRPADPPDAPPPIPCPHCRLERPFEACVPAAALASELAIARAVCASCNRDVRLADAKAHARECAPARAAEEADRAHAHTQWRRHMAELVRSTSTGEERRGGGPGGDARRRRRESDEDEDAGRSSGTLGRSSAPPLPLSPPASSFSDSPPRETHRYVNRSTFTCPLCLADGRVRTGAEDHPGCHLDASALARHLELDHAALASGSRAAVCPICASMPWGDPTYLTRDIAAHVRLRHRFEVRDFADLEEDEEESLRRVMQRSREEEAGGR